MSCQADTGIEPSVEELVAVAEAAGSEILAVYGTQFDVRNKQDASPVTAADERAEALILERLRDLAPGVPIISEEAYAAGQAPAIGDAFWLVDPLDGTKEFVSRNGEFTVNIALVQRGRPMVGVVHAPALGRSYAGRIGEGAWMQAGADRRRIECRRPPAAGLTVVSSRSHGDAAALEAFLAGRRVVTSVPAGSSLKFCLLACGEADLYPRLGRTMEWDTAAGQAVLVAAGGRVLNLAGDELAYGKPGFENPHFVAWGRP